VRTRSANCPCCPTLGTIDAGYRMSSVVNTCAMPSSNGQRTWRSWVPPSAPSATIQRRLLAIQAASYHVSLSFVDRSPAIISSIESSSPLQSSVHLRRGRYRCHRLLLQSRLSLPVFLATWLLSRYPLRHPIAAHRLYEGACLRCIRVLGTARFRRLRTGNSTHLTLGSLARLADRVHRGRIRGAAYRTATKESMATAQVFFVTMDLDHENLLFSKPASESLDVALYKVPVTRILGEASAALILEPG